ncbi:sugar nucleotidyltransferase [Helicobacter sp. 12S02232-10]|uniref:phosphocholine cytidylyltransferase family protein n=1 Tax=Helicobacter sp. 12S02232-10 TaxID=1476197 RepID=UPI000BA5FFE4|nr:phosphocholine cytidylyltransferase family protein [Helicobacter sp. 12S02232-10]PAF48838.1 sugar nucleotidyltransferase [Helicobacter sp. 12S02232-10]
MKALILAAGRGTRLAPLTNTIPKCMVPYQNKPIIDYELDALKCNGIEEIAIVGGYLYPVLQNYLKDNNLRFFINDRFMVTNMVATMFCAKDFMLECVNDKQDLIISYADIIYKHNVVEKLKNFKAELAIIIDKDWEKLWRERFEDPLIDAETLKIKGDKIVEIGKKPTSIQEIQGQYIGLFKISYDFLSVVIDFYETLDKNAIYDGKDFDNMYMTSFLQALIHNYQNASPVFIHRGWTEIDVLEDLKVCL